MTQRTISLLAATMLLLPWATQTAAGAQVVPEPLQPVRFQQIQLDGFWEQQIKQITEKWLPHCVRQMEKGGEGQELLNLINAGNILTKNAAPEKYTGRRFSDAYPHNVMEAMCLALAFDAKGDKDLAAAQAFLRKKIEEWIPIMLAAQMDDGYCEVCAGCGFSFWADRMHRIHKTGHYMDAFERTLYNNILGALELSGEKFYYQNPLESNKPRYSWHQCACCVGNIPRALLAIKDRMYSLNAKQDELYINHFVASEGTIADVAGGPLRITQETEYPCKGDVAITLNPEKKRKFTVRIRIPGRAESALYTAKPDVGNGFTVKVNDKTQSAKIENGYVAIRRQWTANDRIDLSLPMDVQRVYCDERAEANRGRVAIQRGPIVYSVEDVDNDLDVRKLTLKPDATLTAEWNQDLLGGVMTITSDGFTAIPNYARLNRGGWSQVWIMED